jgi:hypothetical protein
LTRDTRQAYRASAVLGALLRWRTGVIAGAAITVVAVLALAPTALADTVTLPAEADTFVRSGDSTPHGADPTFDVHGGASSYTCGTGPAFGLVRFDLDAIPAGATIQSARLELTSVAGFAFDGDPVHRALFLSNDAWNEGTVVWPGPDDGVTPVAPPGEWTIDGVPLSSSPNVLGSANAFSNVGCAGTEHVVRNFNSAGSSNLAARIATERAGDGKLSLEIHSIACGTPFTIVCQNGLLEQAYFLRYGSKEGNPADAPRLVVDYTTASKPTLVRAVPNGGGTTVIGRVDGGGTTANLTFLSSATCANGQLGGTPTSIGAVTAPLDANGYFSVGVANVPNLSFVAARLTASTESSPCVVAKAANDAWPTALGLTGSGALTTQDIIDSPGQSRWYAFDVQPGSELRVNVSGLPADYDLALFKDISQAYTSLTSTQDLTRLSAEYAPSVFSPSVFSPSVFSPSVFSPDAYAPSVFSPSVFSPSVFSPSVFSPSVFSPSVFSPSVFSPSVFSPSVFSPSVFSPSVFSPSVFSPSVFSPEAFASAQTRSLVAVSATPGTADETVVANTWNNSGRYYVRVSSRSGAFSTSSAYQVSVTRGPTTCPIGIADTGSPPPDAPAAGVKTVILTYPSRMPGTPTERDALADKLQTLADRPEVEGAVVDLSQDPRIVALTSQADANKACPYAKNLLADAIKDVVDSYRKNNPLQYVTIVGGDNVVPFFRSPDESLLGQESGYFPPVGSTTASESSLRLDYVLSQDAYGSKTGISLRSTTFPVPDLAVGRLVETAADASGMIDAYLDANGVMTPHSSLVTGYDFLADSANAVKTELQAGTNVTPETLITAKDVSPQDSRSWTATQLRSTLLGPTRHDIVYLAGHFSANSALAADFSTSVLTTELESSSTNFKNTLVFSAGCHSGYNLVDGDAVPGVTQTLDWAQAFARKQATLVAGTGYQYGDTDFLEYSERIYRNFAQELRTGLGAVSVGDALLRAKQRYLETTPDIRGIHEKALLEATVFGLPMFSINMTGSRLSPPGGSSVVGGLGTFDTDPGATLGLRSVDVPVPVATSAKTVPLTNLSGGNLTATYYEGPDGVVTNPAEPAIPLKVVDVTPPDGSVVLRGVGFRGGAYADSTVVPLTGAPTTELRGVHVPFVSPVFFPMRLATVNYFDVLGGGTRTALLVTPAQHKALDIGNGTSTLRLFSQLDLRLYYSGYLGTSALSAAPDITSVDAVNTGGQVEFSAHVSGNPAAGIQQVWVTYTGDGPSRWASLDLVQDPVDSTLWTGTLNVATPANLRFVVQAVNGVGLVSLDDALGAYYRVSGTTTAAPKTTSLELQSPPTSGAFGSSKTVSAKLLESSTPLAGKSVLISIGSSSRIGVTGADGVATVTIPVNVTPGPTQIKASFAGDDAYLPSDDSAAFAAAKADSALSAFTSQLSVVTSGGTSGVTTTLTADLGGKSAPLLQQTVTFTLAGPASKTYSTITDYLGRASLPTTGLAAGTYSVTARFAGDSTYTAVTRTGTVTVSLFTGFQPPVNNLPTVNSVKAGSAVPVKFSLGGDRGLAILAAGSPVVTAVSCESGVAVDEIETTVANSSSGLTFDDGVYTYVWKTPKSFAGTCRQIDVKLVDGTSHVALFKLR